MFQEKQVIKMPENKQFNVNHYVENKNKESKDEKYNEIMTKEYIKKLISNHFC